MNLISVLLVSAVAHVSAGTTAYYEVKWVKGDNSWTTKLGCTGSITVAANAKLEVALPPKYSCLPGEIPKTEVLDAADPPAASKWHCAGANAKEFAKLECSTDGKKVTITNSATECGSGAVSFTVKGSRIYPTEDVTTRPTDTLKVGDETPSATDSNYKLMNAATAMGEKVATGGKITISAPQVGATGTLTYESTLPAGVTFAADDKVCLFYPGHTLQTGSKCNITVDTTAAAKPIDLTGDAKGYTCLTTAQTDQIAKAGKKFKIVCDKFKAPAAKQIAAGFGVLFTDDSAGTSLVRDTVALSAVDKTLAPTRAPTAPTRAPTRAFSAASRSTAAATGFVFAVLGYFVI
jgi:hypothetical protein